MHRFLKFLVGFLFVAVLIGGFYTFVLLPPKLDKKMNVVLPHKYQVSDDALAFHKTLRLADSHDDMLLWKRNPRKRHTYGQADLPRLREGGFALQVFSAVTYVPKGLNTGKNTKSHDQLKMLSLVEGWPANTRNSILNRALYQAKRLHRVEHKENGAFVIAKTKSDLKKALERRKTDKTLVIGILETEGAHPLEGKLENIDVLYKAGYRMFGLQHFFDNALGGSLHGVSKQGLTPFGKQVVEDMGKKGILIDLAHSSIQTVKDVLAMTDGPVVISHTGLLGYCNHPERNIPDALIKQIADRGGLIGVGYWETAACDPSPDGIAKMLIYGVNTFGPDAIALGSDFDGAVTTTFDASELALLTDALLKAGMSKENIRKVMGENQIAFFLKNLPDE